MSTLGRHVTGVRKHTCPRIAACSVPQNSEVVRSLHKKLVSERSESPDFREIVAQRSEQLSKVSPCEALQLPPDPWEEGAHCTSGLQKLARIISESFLVARLALKLFGYVGFGWRWICAFLQLLAYAGFLMPGFAQMVAFYFLSKRVIRGVRYGPQSRNVLDVYLPPTQPNVDQDGHPVVVYVTGGAWTIGYKAWGALLSRRLSQAGVLVCCLDYRNFPQGTALDMIEDINHGMGWVQSHVASYGGDPNRVYMCGQSCGGHLASLAILTQAEQQGHGKPVPGGYPAWDLSRLKGFIGVSGVYNVHDLVDHFDRRGLYKSLFLKIMSIHGEPQLKLLSPVYVASHGLQDGGSRGGEVAAGQGEGDDERDPLLWTAGSRDLAEAEEGGQWGKGGMREQMREGEGMWRGESAAALYGPAAPPQQQQPQQLHRFQGDSSGSLLIGAGWGGDGQEGEGGSGAGQGAGEGHGPTSDVGAIPGPPSSWVFDAEGCAAGTAAVEVQGLGGRDGQAGAPGVVEVAAAALARSPVELMPPMLLLHGDADRCAPLEGAHQFAAALRRAGVPVELQLLRGETHTSPLLENPMRGGEDDLTNSILSLVTGHPVSRSYPALCPRLLIWMAARVCPF